MRNFCNDFNKKIMLYDGSKTVQLRKMGIGHHECEEVWNSEQPDKVSAVYRTFIDIGCDVIQTNTFQGNRLSLDKHGLGDRTYELNFNAARLAKEAAGNKVYIAGAVGPTGILSEPSGNLTFDKAYEVFKEQIEALIAGGCDLIHFETFTDLKEMRAAILAMKDVSELPFICNFAFEKSGKTLMGDDPVCISYICYQMGAVMTGANCSFGSEGFVDIAEKLSITGIPLCIKPNAGLPEIIDGNVKFKENPERFAEFFSGFFSCGTRLAGGCCGTTPEHISEVGKVIKSIENTTVNPTISKVIATNKSYITEEKISQCEIYCPDASEVTQIINAICSKDYELIDDVLYDIAGKTADIVKIDLDKLVNDSKVAEILIKKIQEIVNKPLIVRSNNLCILHSALKAYNGVAAISSEWLSYESSYDLQKTFGAIIVR